MSGAGKRVENSHWVSSDGVHHYEFRRKIMGRQFVLRLILSDAMYQQRAIRNSELRGARAEIAKHIKRARS